MQAYRSLSAVAATIRLLLLVYCCTLVLRLEGRKLSGDSSANTVGPRIVGGIKVSKHYPYVVSLVLNGVHSCGGAIINERTIITAAHCLEGMTPSQIRVHAGDITLALKKGKLYNVAAIHKHPNWQIRTMDYDVGVIRLNSSLPYGGTMKPIVLSSASDRVSDGDYATVLGWGTTSYMGKESNTLRMAYVPIVRRSLCNRYLSKMITPRMLCAGFRKGGVDACQMDSGGPLVAKNKLIGIVSWGVGCAERMKPGVYARISELRGWAVKLLKQQYGESLR